MEAAITRTDSRLAGIQAVLFDMDGTLVDSSAAVESIWSAWAERNSIPIADVLAWCHGRDVAATITHFLPHIDSEILQSIVNAQLDQECIQLDSIKPAAGALELLIWLEAHHIPWGVVTNAPRRLALARLSAATIDPPLLVTLEDVAHGKPAPDGYLHAVRSCGATPARTLAVEDSASGLAAARSAGTVVVAVGGRSDADIVCHDLVDLHRLLVQMRSA